MVDDQSLSVLNLCVWHWVHVHIQNTWHARSFTLISNQGLGPKGHCPESIQAFPIHVHDISFDHCN